MADPLAFTNLSEVEEQKRNQNMAKARMNYYSYNLKLRLQYAKLKVEHGWQQQSLSEVENLYFRHSRQPYPNTYPRKKTFRSNKNPSPLTAEATIVDSTSFSDTPLAASGSISSLARSDTLQTIPDSSSTMTSSRSSTLPNFTVGSSDVSRYPTIGIKYPVPVRLVSPPSTTTNGSLASHSQTLSVDPNIDPALLSSPSMQPPTLPAHDSVQPSPTISSSSSYFAPRESSVIPPHYSDTFERTASAPGAIVAANVTPTYPACTYTIPTLVVGVWLAIDVRLILELASE
ncbi:hypothetical protein EUX98_g6058 [Antrodiella citrinella]|uniref:Uncharacterized protein n=1 Tax=Antrodiella citrinella TaxID=2447956 RepID=A0A4S4MQY6_9APHY|nr:hypothetical protein EUX98_g6058 [Antrodiella citrinella]